MCLHVWKGTSVLLEWCPDLCLCICVPWATTALSTLLLRCLACQDTIKTELGRVHARPAKAAFTALDIRILHRWMARSYVRVVPFVPFSLFFQFCALLALFLLRLVVSFAFRARECSFAINLGFLFHFCAHLGSIVPPIDLLLFLVLLDRMVLSQGRVVSRDVRAVPQESTVRAKI